MPSQSTGHKTSPSLGMPGVWTEDNHGAHLGFRRQLPQICHVTSGHLAHPIISEMQGCNICSSLPEEHQAGTFSDPIFGQQQAQCPTHLACTPQSSCIPNQHLRITSTSVLTKPSSFQGSYHFESHTASKLNKLIQPVSNTANTHQ